MAKAAKVRAVSLLISVSCVVTRITKNLLVLLPNPLLVIKTPLRWNAWRQELEVAGCLNKFVDVSIGIRKGFQIGVSSAIYSTLTSHNHKFSSEYPKAITSHITTELSTRWYSGLFHLNHLATLIGSFCSSPMDVIPKSTPGEWCIIQNFSFPCNNPTTPLINAEINSKKF